VLQAGERGLEVRQVWVRLRFEFCRRSCCCRRGRWALQAEEGVRNLEGVEMAKADGGRGCAGGWWVALQAWARTDEGAGAGVVVRA
jgi:hypothetical protein